MNHPLSNMMGDSMQKLREMADANTIIGDPIETPDGVTILPVSKVKIGYAGGGSDFATKNYPPNRDNSFGGGSGASVTVTPVAFLIVKGEAVRLLPVTEPPSGAVDRLVEMLPDLIEQVSALVKKKTDKTDKAE